MLEMPCDLPVLDQVILREVHLPLREPFVTSAERIESRRIVLLELQDTDGARAWSECVALERPTYTPETVDIAWLTLRDWLVPAVLGRSFATPAEVDHALRTTARGHPMARAAIEMGYWGLAAERAGISLAVLLGGVRESVATGLVIGLQPDDDTLINKAHTALAEGYQRLKVKIAPGRDLAPLTALRAALGPDVALWADANSAYSLADTDHLRHLDALGLELIEQPLAWDDLRRHALLQKHLATPICLDESLDDPARVEDMLALDAGRIVNLKPGRVGGLTSALEIHALCVGRGVPLWLGGMLESGIGRAYNLALAALPGFTRPGDLSPSSRYWQRDLVDPEWTMDAKGRVAVPRERPGLGVEIDTDRIAALTVRTERLVF